MAPERSDRGRTTDRKAVLFCPACDRAAPVDGAWSHEEHDAPDGDRTDVTCPECGRLVVSQPEFPTATGKRSAASAATPVLQLVDSVVRHHVL